MKMLLSYDAENETGSLVLLMTQLKQLTVPMISTAA